MAVAGLLSIATASGKIYFDEKFKHPIVTSGIMTALLAFLLIGPILYFAISITTAIQNFDPATLEKMIVVLKELINNLPNEINIYRDEIISYLNSVNYAEISKFTLGILGQTGAKSASFLKDIILILIFFFMFHLYGEKSTEFLIKAMPYKSGTLKRTFKETSSTMSTVLYSLIATAIFEGTLFGVFISFFGYDGFLFGMLYGFASLVPVVGGILMWLPISIYELSIGNSREALIIMLYTVVVISIIADTFVRPIIIEIINKKINKTASHIHSLLIFFSIVAGLSTFGFWGAILGPGITAMFFGATLLLTEEHSVIQKLKR
jgi:predicted PurR-regulated permease PerM